MNKISLFAEDHALETVVSELVKRIAAEYNLKIDIKIYSNTGGHGRMLSELKRYIRDYKNGLENYFDLLIIARDSNCEGYKKRKKAIQKNTECLSGKIDIIYALPEPHVEKWLLIDTNAFKKVFDTGCDLPSNKCKKDYYKHILSKYIASSGITSTLIIGYIPELVRAMDLDYISNCEKSFNDFISETRSLFARLRS